MPKCASCGSELEYSWWTDENGTEHSSFYANFKYLEILQCPNCKLIYGLEMKF